VAMLRAAELVEDYQAQKGQPCPDTDHHNANHQCGVTIEKIGKQNFPFRPPRFCRLTSLQLCAINSA